MYKYILGAFFTFMAVMFVRCGEVTEIDELVKQTERVQIVYNTNLGAYQDITDKKEIRAFSDYILDEPTPLYKCGYDGYMIFFTEHGSVRMDFNLQDDCIHVLYPYGETLQTRLISKEGVAYLRSQAP
ncbi:MAG: hypothetical protein H6548_11845 [Chitinophagales bacterium]|nr:hypothetical protein [Chitinophagales bacterium]HAE12794.1 hypothetical protein [Bacteroidota bacterium]MCB9019601.1 hypothetical protein [Chitinophagales bacterium]MCB9022803.1 hypothetical protein [Chitinophagales bacterium]HAE34180.1 hypothetical protein [Bacteroidota bacterium]